MFYKRLALACMPLCLALITIGAMPLQASAIPQLMSTPIGWQMFAPVPTIPYVHANLAANTPVVNTTPNVQTDGALSSGISPFESDHSSEADTTPDTANTDLADTAASPNATDAQSPDASDDSTPTSDTDALAPGTDAPAADETTTSDDASTTTPVTIQIVLHLCNPSVQSLADFDALGQGTGALAAFAAKEAACPVTVLPQNSPSTNASSAPQTSFDFTVTGADAASKKLSTDTTFHNDTICENALRTDINGDGTTSPSTCLDDSHYDFSNIPGPNVEVTENEPPSGYLFGTVLFTPEALRQNNDADSLISVSTSTNGTGTINLNTASDTDNVIMLHVFDFPASSTSGVEGFSDNGDGSSPDNTADNSSANPAAAVLGMTPQEFQQQQWQQIRSMMQQIHNLEQQLYQMLGGETASS